MIKIHSLQHVPFEDLANIKTWADHKGYSISETKLFNNEALPDLKNFDWLVILGGPMNIYEEDQYSWLKVEKEFIKQAINNNKTVIGICLGAQLIADALGAKIYRNQYKEIGWLPVTLTQEAQNLSLFQSFPQTFEAFHWHGDTFDLPQECTLLATSEACRNQAFIYNSRVIGLQFHIEYTLNSIAQMLYHCADELVEGKYIQNKDVILGKKELVLPLSTILFNFLNNLDSKV